MFRLETLGGLTLKTPTGPPQGAGTQRQPLALLAMLAVAGRMSRDKAMTMLWPESDQVSARNRLKQAIYALRRDLLCHHLVIGSSEIELNRDFISVDIWDFNEAVSGGDLNRAADLYQGPFLDGVFLAGAIEFERWVDDQRTALAHQFSTAAEALVEVSAHNRNFGRAVAVSRRMVSLDPLNTRTAALLVEALVASGDRASALQHAQQHIAHLKQELDAVPQAFFVKLIASIRLDGISHGPHGLPDFDRTDPPFQPVEIKIAEPAVESSKLPDVPAHGALVSLTPLERRIGAATIPPTKRMFPLMLAASVLLALAVGTSMIGPSWLPMARARVEYQRGKTAMSQWNTEIARAHFRLAVTSDTGFANAYLSLAELASWNQTDPIARDEMRWAARLALQHGQRLSSLSQTYANALAALSDGHWIDACREFGKLIEHDSTSYSAWFGRAECLLADDAVVPDSVSPSGWSFRTSYQETIRSYLRAFALRPEFHRAFGGNSIAHLSRVLFLRPNRVRRGTRADTPTVQLAAFPEWRGDSIAFIPFPLEDFQRRRPGAMPSTTVQAIAHNKETLRQLTTSWIAASPLSSDAYEARAAVLEVVGEVDVAYGGATAASSLLSARAYSNEPQQQLRLAVTDVRFRLKRSDFRGAARLVDSLLRNNPDPTPVVAQWLAPLAALTRQPNTAARLQRIAAPLAPLPVHGATWSDLPLPVTAEWLALLTFAAASEPVDSIETTYHQFESLVTLLEPTARNAVRAAMLQEPSRFLTGAFADSVWSIVDTVGDPIAAMQLSLRRGDLRAVHTRFRALETARANSRLADRWPDAVFLESRLLVAARDTNRAIAMIDPYLAALSVINPSILDRVQTASSLSRLMLLRAAIATARNDSSTSSRWRSAAADLQSFSIESHAAKRSTSIRIR